jgi:hypothetical protein
VIEDFAHAPKHTGARTAVACALVILTTAIGIGCGPPASVAMVPAPPCASANPGTIAAERTRAAGTPAPPGSTPAPPSPSAVPATPSAAPSAIATAAPATAAPSPATTGCLLPASITPATLTFGAVGTTQAAFMMDSNSPNGPFGVVDCPSIASAAALDGNRLTIISKGHGTCTLTMTDQFGVSASVTATVTGF